MAWVKCEIRVLGILDRINNQLLVLKSILLRGVGPLIQQLRPDPTCLLPSGSGPFPSSFMLSCVRLCDPMDCYPPGSSVHGIPPARILEWGAISFTGDLRDPGIKPESLASLELTDGFFTTWEAFLSTWK